MAELQPQPEQNLRPGARKRLAHLAVASVLTVGAAIGVESGLVGKGLNYVYGPAADVPSDLDDANNMPDVPPTTQTTVDIDESQR